MTLRGDRHWNVKIKADMIAEIRGKYKKGGTVKYRDLAREYGVSVVTIHRLMKGTYQFGSLGRIANP